MKSRLEDVKSYVQKHDNIVDLGIGKGYYYSGVEPKNVTGVDIKGQYLGRVNKNFPWIKTVLRDMRDTGLPDKSFDLVILSQVIKHFKDYEPVIKEAKRLCKDDGYFYVATPIECYHKLHFHPVWSKEDMENLAKKFGEIIELKEIKEKISSWVIYVKNGGKY